MLRCASADSPRDEAATEAAKAASKAITSTNKTSSLCKESDVMPLSATSQVPGGLVQVQQPSATNLEKLHTVATVAVHSTGCQSSPPWWRFRCPGTQDRPTNLNVYPATASGNMEGRQPSTPGKAHRIDLALAYFLAQVTTVFVQSVRALFVALHDGSIRYAPAGSALSRRHKHRCSQHKVIEG